MNTMHLNPHETGKVVGSLVVTWHVIWLILIWVGWAQPLMDFVLWAHMIHVQVTVGVLEPLPVITLVVLTALSGYALGFLFAVIWDTAYDSPLFPSKYEN